MSTGFSSDQSSMVHLYLSESGTWTQQPCILIIDDDVDSRALVKFRLETREGFEVLLAEDGASGLQIAAEKRPDLILLDWVMPGMSGLEVLSRLKTEDATSGIPVVMLTGRRMMNDVERAVERGADWYVTKPVDLTGLSRVVRKTLELD